MKKILVVGLMMLSVGFAARPFSVEDSGVLEKGLELEMSYNGYTDGAIRENEKGFVLNASLTPGQVQLGYERSYLDMQNHPWGTGDSVVSLKYNFLDNQALKAGLQMTDGDELHEFGERDAESNLTYAYDLQCDRLTVFTNLNWIVDDQVFSGVGLQYAVLDSFSLCTELVQDTGMLGLIWTVYDIPVDFSYTAQSDAKEYVYALGVTYGF
jgi:hypothetical protein